MQEAIKNGFISFKKNSYIVRAMVVKNVKEQYRNSVLGILWTVLNPLLNMAVMAVVFSNLFGRGDGIADYPVYILSGSIIFTLMRSITESSLGSIVYNADLIKKVKISYEVFPVSNMFSGLVNFFFSFIALLVVVIIRPNVGLSFSLLWTIIYIPSILLFSLGIGYVLCSMFVYFRDIKHLYTVFTTLWMYLTPVFYTVESLNLKKGLVGTIISLNPMYYYVEVFRGIVLNGIVDWHNLFICYLVGFVFAILGSIFFKLTKRKFILHI
ncbi:MAG: ABC transporter permease [Clostridia bacterium]|nr:ABC transporter permease [Clostridia bacterium]